MSKDREEKISIEQAKGRSIILLKPSHFPVGWAGKAEAAAGAGEADGPIGLHQVQ